VTPCGHVAGKHLVTWWECCVFCLCTVCDSVWDACLEAAGIELYLSWNFIELAREGNTRVRNGKLLSLNVVKQRHVIVRNTG